MSATHIRPQDFESCRKVFLSDQQVDGCSLRPHRLRATVDRGVNAVRFEGALGQFGVNHGRESADDDKLGIHSVRYPYKRNGPPSLADRLT